MTEFDRYGNSNPNINYEIVAIASGTTYKNVGPIILKPTVGAAFSKIGPMNLLVNLKPGPRLSNLFVSLKVKKAISVSFTYISNSGMSKPHVVSHLFLLNSLITKSKCDIIK